MIKIFGAVVGALIIGLFAFLVYGQGIYICQGVNCPPSLNGITLSNSTFNSGAPSGTVIGNLLVATTGQAFNGSYAAPGGPDGASFQVINNNQLATNGVVAAAGSTQNYNIAMTANQATAVNSSITVPITVTAQQVPTAVIYNPASPISVFDNITTATTISAVSVTSSDGHTFFGSLSLTANAGGRVTLSGNNIVPAHNFTSADDGANLTVTVQASENGTSVSANLSLTVNASAASIALSIDPNDAFIAGLPTGTTIAAISSTLTGTVTYSLDTACGTNCADASKFQISGSSLQTGGTAGTPTIETANTCIGADNGTTPVSCTFTSPLPAGDEVLCTGALGASSNNLTSVADNVGNTLSLIDFVSDVADNQGGFAYHFDNVTAGAQTFTATGPATGSSRIECSAFKNIATVNAIDNAGAAHHSAFQASVTGTANAVSSGALGVTPATSGDLLWAWTQNTNSNATIGAGATPAYTSISTTTTASVALPYGMEYLVQSAPANIAGTFTNTTTGGTAHSFATGVVALKPGSSGPGNGTYHISIIANNGTNNTERAFTLTGAAGPLTVALAPTSLSIGNDATTANPATLSTASVTMSDGSGFAGTLSSGGLCATSGLNVTLAGNLSSGNNGTNVCPVTATQNNIPASANLTLTVSQQTLTGVSPATASFASGVTSAPVATLSPTFGSGSPSIPAPVLSIANALSSDAGCASATLTASSFVLTGNSLTTNGSLAAGTYCIHAISTVAGATGSPATTVLVLTGTTTSATAFAMPAGDVLHFMAANGNDACNGTSAAIGTSGNCAWATPNHAMNCGDVIVAAAGSYQGSASFGTVSNCPSTTGGIDGSGGIWATTLLCGGSDLASNATTSCYINCATAACSGPPGDSIGSGFAPTTSFWSIQGWVINSAFGTTGSNFSAYQPTNCTGGPAIHYLSFINTLVYNGGQAFTPQDCGNGVGTSNYGADYFAVVGMIAQNSNQNSICLAAIDAVSGGVFGTATDTHNIFYNNYAFNNQVPACASLYDGETYMWDTMYNHGPHGKYVAVNNIGYYATRSCIQTEGAVNTTTSATMRWYNNTCYSSNIGCGPYSPPASTNCMYGEFSIYVNGNTTYQVFNNIGYTPNGLSHDGVSPIYGFLIDSGAFVGAVGGAYASGDNNIFLSTATTCGGTCNSGPPYSASSGTTLATLGTNTYTNPSFADASDLISNRLGVPNCAGFVNTTACMGWNANAKILTKPTADACPSGQSCTNYVSGQGMPVIFDLYPTAAGMSGKGFQLPSTTCVASGEFVNDYPAWLKGLVYLHWTGTTVMQNHDLATTPCGL